MHNTKYIGATNLLGGLTDWRWLLAPPLFGGAVMLCQSIGAINLLGGLTDWRWLLAPLFLGRAVMLCRIIGATNLLGRLTDWRWLLAPLFLKNKLKPLISLHLFSLEIQRKTTKIHSNPFAITPMCAILTLSVNNNPLE